MAQDEGRLSAQKGPWTTPTLSFDGRLGDIVQGSRKPTAMMGEPGDPGHRPESD